MGIKGYVMVRRHRIYDISTGVSQTVLFTDAENINKDREEQEYAAEVISRKEDRARRERDYGTAIQKLKSLGLSEGEIEALREMN